MLDEEQVRAKRDWLRAKQKEFEGYGCKEVARFFGFRAQDLDEVLEEETNERI